MGSGFEKDQLQLIRGDRLRVARVRAPRSHWGVYGTALPDRQSRSNGVSRGVAYPVAVRR